MIRLASILSLMATGVFANPMVIRSGEHATFTRLVFSIEANEEWSVEEVEKGYEISFEKSSDGFDLEGVFERIPRTRLQDLTQTGLSTLRLDLDCICHLDIFLWRSDRLVVDVVDGAEPYQKAGGQSEDAPSVPSLARQAINQLPDIFELPNNLTLTGGASTEFLAPSNIPENNINLSVNGTEELPEESLLEGVSRAASQGILTPAQEKNETYLRITEPLNERNMPLGQVSEEEQSNLGIDVSTALDQSLRTISQSLNRIEERNCLDESTYNIAEWSDGRSFHDQASDIAEDLIGEFDVEPVGVEIRLAKLYIHFSFGAEAISALRSSDEVSLETQVLMEMARIIDGYEGPFPNLAMQGDCGGHGTFWGILAGGPVPNVEADIQELQRHYFLVPQPLRSHIAPKLSQFLLDNGWPEAAENILRATEGTDISDIGTTKVAQANLALDRDDTPAAVEILRSTVTSSPRVDPESVIQLIELTMGDGGLPSQDDILILEGMEREYKGLEVHDKIAVTLAKAYSARGDFSTALEFLNGRIDPASQEVKSLVYYDIASTNDTEIFLSYAFQDLPKNLDDQTVNRFAERLSNLGFPEQAMVILDRPARQEAASERRYLRAASAIRAREFDTAIDAISGINSDRANELRALIYEKSGEHQNALEASPLVNGESQSLNEFRAQAWERLRGGDDPALANFAASRLAVVGADDTISLDDRRAVLDRSAESRLAIDDLLSRFENPVSDN